MSPNAEELRRRIAHFVDASLSDESVRNSFFERRGSEKYLDGDSRGWKLTEARRKMFRDARRGERIKKVLYRPFNEWFVFWADYMVDWPRNDVMKHMEHDNCALLFSRNVEIPSAEHFFCTDKIAGHHSVSLKEVNYMAPLFLYETDVVGNVEMFASRRPNFSEAFLKRIAAAINVPQEPEFGLPEGISPEDIFHYIYAVFHAPGYRSRYAEFLKRDFPRVPLTADIALFRALGAKGRELVALHLLKAEDAPQLDDFLTGFPVTGTDEVLRVKHTPENGRVWINADQYFSSAPEATWNFHIGGYQVCEKWSKDRKGRTLADDDLQHWQRVVVALTETRRLMAEIDALIPEWPLL